MRTISLSNRQKRIAEIVRQDGPITGEHIAERLNVTRAALRSDLAILVMGGILDARPKVGYYFTGKNTLGMLMEEISGILVRDLQSVPVAVNHDKSAYEAVVTMFLEDVGTVFVLDEAGLLVGVVSRKDLLKAAINNGSDLREIPVVMVMTPLSKLIVVKQEDSVASAARKIIDNEIDCLPVIRCVGEDKRSYEVVGRITKTNFTRLLVDLAKEAIIIAKLPIIYAVSDSIGETAESVVKATTSQFVQEKFDVIRVPYVKDKAQVEKVIEEAKENNGIICYTVVSPELREHIAHKAMEHDVEVVDVLGPMLKAIEKTSGLLPKNQAGLIHALDHEYFKRVEAVEFAVKYDDGKNPLGLAKADVVIIGVSRTSKTPLSMYLAHKQIKVANVPLVPEIMPPEELFKVPPHKIIGLLIDPFKLNEIRSERLKTMGLTDGAAYADVKRINEELEYAKGIMRRLHCTIINVSNRAIEETAGMILEYVQKNKDRR